MLITRMEVLSPQPSVPDLPLGGFVPNNEVIQIRDIQGLGPVKSDVAFTPYATGRGELFQGSSTPKRNIVLNLALSPNYASQTMATLRQLLYRYFMPETWCDLKFYSDELPVVSIRGLTESFEPNLFSQDPEIQISILCNHPDFFDLSTTLLTGETDSSVVEVDYEGTVLTGFQLKIESTGSYSGGISVIVERPDLTGESFAAVGVTINPSLYFELNTVRSMRYVFNIDPSFPDDAFNILSKMTKPSSWPEFYPGTNMLTIAADSPSLAWTLGYRKRYGGL